MNETDTLKRALTRELAKAGIRTPAGKYAATAAIAAASVFSLSTISFSAYLSGHVTYAILLSIPVGMIALSLFYVYPLMRSSARAREIDEQLPAAFAHVSEEGCSDVHSLFRMLSERGRYGELSAEARRALHHTYALGTDGRTAALRAAETTPSAMLKNLLTGLPSGRKNFGKHLEETTTRLLSERRRVLRHTEQRNSRFAEGYAAFLVLAPILLFSLARDPLTLRLGAYLAMPIANVIALSALCRQEA